MTFDQRTKLNNSWSPTFLTTVDYLQDFLFKLRSKTPTRTQNPAVKNKTQKNILLLDEIKFGKGDNIC